MAKKTVDIQQIIELNKQGYSNSAIAKKLNVALRSVQRNLNTSLFSVRAWRDELKIVVYLDETRYEFPSEWKIDRAILAALKKSKKISIIIYKN